MQLSKRLDAVAKLAGRCHCVADIGTDHGYIPIYMVRQELAQSAIAMDVNKGPLKRAQQNVQAYQMEEKITTRLSDGVKQLKKGEADCVIIAGMGGLLTIRILEDGAEVLECTKTLVLQPQSEIGQVRDYLQQNGYCITAENMVLDEGKYYPMMQVKRGKQEKWEEQEIAFGKYLIQDNNPVLRSFLEKEEKLCEEILQSLDGKKGEHIAQRQNEIRKRQQLIWKAKEQMK